MIRLMLVDGSHRELPQAETAALEHDYLVCRDAEGRIVLRLERLLVTAYGKHNALSAEWAEMDKLAEA